MPLPTKWKPFLFEEQLRVLDTDAPVLAQDVQQNGRFRPHRLLDVLVPDVLRIVRATVCLEVQSCRSDIFGRQRLPICRERQELVESFLIEPSLLTVGESGVETAERAVVLDAVRSMMTQIGEREHTAVTDRFVRLLENDRGREPAQTHLFLRRDR